MVTTLRLPDDLHEDLKRQAERRGLTFNAHILNILWETHKENENSKRKQERGD